MSRPPASGTVSETGVVPAPPARVYQVLADYRREHPLVLPTRYFGPLLVEEGGYGAGSRIVVSMRAFGRVRSMRAVVAEPNPGRVLLETLEDGTATTFTVAEAGPGGTELTISTTFPARAGASGALERWVVRRFLGKVYRAELAQLAAYVTRHPDAPA